MTFQPSFLLETSHSASLYLASGSPRRQELLAQLGVTFERIVTGIEEQRQPQESAQQYVVRLAREKARAGVAQTAKDLPVLGADTIVILNGEVLEKPRDAEHAAQMLRKLHMPVFLRSTV